MEKLYRVTLTSEEIELLENILSKGKHTAQKRNRAQALLHAHNGWKDKDISESTGLTTQAIELLRKRFVEDGFETTLNGKKKQSRPRVLDGRAEAHLVALVCSQKPEGRARWTLRLLRDRLVADLEDLKSISHETIRRTLKKTNLGLGNE
jgi:transposase